MSRDSILRIREVEEEAEAIVKRAKDDAASAEEKAHAAGKQLLLETKLEAEKNADESMRELQMRLSEVSQKLREEATSEAAELRRKVALRRKIAEKIIIRGLDAKCR